jgi:leucine-rich repeat-containing protein 16
MISALRYNLWFESLNCEDIKLSSDIQDEINHVLSMPQSKLRSLSLVHCNLKSDFLQKLSQTLNQVRNNTKIINLKQIFRQINLSRNSIEDRGAQILSQILKDFNSIDLELNKLEYLALSKCSLNSKGINSLCSSLKAYSTSLTHLDLSHNSLKDDPNELFHYLSENNSLVELNLVSSDIDLEKLLVSLNKGCLFTLERLILASNTNHSKSINAEIIYSYFQQSKLLNFIDFSNCKLTGVFVQ